MGTGGAAAAPAPPAPPLFPAGAAAGAGALEAIGPNWKGAIVAGAFTAAEVRVKAGATPGSVTPCLPSALRDAASSAALPASPLPFPWPSALFVMPKSKGELPNSPTGVGWVLAGGGCVAPGAGDSAKICEEVN